MQGSKAKEETEDGVKLVADLRKRDVTQFEGACSASKTQSQN